MDGLIRCFDVGLLHQGDRAETLQAMVLVLLQIRNEEQRPYMC